VLLTISPAIISAFAPGRTAASGNNVLASNNISAAKSTPLKMAGKSARSNEEDLELTRAIIMQHISSADDNAADDDEQSGASMSSSGVSADGKGKLKKIKSFGSKMKSKIKSKLEKDE